ncbi:amidohydrolase family protein [Micromonospora chersina]|uniref:amidohydrolase family protein n=1 Tax=Micromonospora chersina TaxID=47854 RepID=UPI003719C7D6
MSRSFAGEQGNVGIAVTPYEDLVRLFARAAGAGIAVATHAIGDRANHLVIDAYEAVGRTPGLRHRIEHAQHLRPADLARMADLGIVGARPDGTPAGGWQPEQRPSMAEAVTAHTLGAARAAGEDDRKGVLAPGKLADFIAVDTDPYRESPDAVLRTRVMTTVVGGEIRWQRT